MLVMWQSECKRRFVMSVYRPEIDWMPYEVEEAGAEGLLLLGAGERGGQQQASSAGLVTA